MSKFTESILFLLLVSLYVTFATPICDCGKERISARIVGGNEAIPYAYPWLVSLIDSDRDPYCGGSMITKDYLLTAAHCLFNTETKQMKKTTEIRVVMGAHDMYKRRNTLTFRVDSWIIHPKYKSVDNYDIALVKLKFPNERIRQRLIENITPICLPTAEFATSANFIIAGWGRTATSGIWSRKLLEAHVQGTPLSECRRKFEDENIITERHICAGDSKKDSCEGDSGGPLMQKKNGKHYLYGIASFGEECAHSYKPGIYTRVYSYIDWITENVKSADSCMKDEIISKV